MAVQLSPGIVVQEFDFSQIVPAVSSSRGAAVSLFRWGPVGERVLIDSEPALVARFGKPSDLNAEGWFSIANFLAYGAPAYVVRAANTTSTNGEIGVLTAFANVGAVANVLAQLVLSEDDYLTKDGDFDEDILYLARYPGALGNSLRVSECLSANDYRSSINLASFGNTGATYSINVGSNVATITLTAASVIAANANATALVAKFAVTDNIETGNSDIGRQYMKVTNLAAAALGNTTVGNATITISFEDPMRLHTNFASTTTVARYWEYYSLVGRAPGQSSFVANHGNVSANDELHLVVVDDGGKFTGVPGTVLEVYKNLSRATDAKGLDNGSVYYKTVVNQQSRYIWWATDADSAVSNTANNVVSATNPGVIEQTFAGGADGADEDDATLATFATAWDEFANKEDVDVSLLIAGKAKGGVDGTQLANYVIDNIAEIRKDCVTFASPEQDDVVNNYGDELTDVTAFTNSLRASSYRFMDTGYKQQYDKYNDVFRWIPLNGDVAGITARVDYTNDPWWAPAGFNRGYVKNLTQVAYNPRLAERDLLYGANVNPVVTFPGSGTILFGNRTGLFVESAFRELNIRRLFIVLEKAISKMANAFLFEFNDEFTRAQFKNVVIPYLRDIKARRGITDFLVRCDENNNTPQVIDQNRFIGDIFVKPNRAIAYIQLNFVAVATAIQFSEIENAVP